MLGSLKVNRMVNDLLPLNDVFSALADPTRRRILEMLMSGERVVSDISAAFKVSAPAISRHLRVLERASLLRREKRGREHFLSLDAKPMKEASAWMAEYRVFWEHNLDSLEVFLGESSEKEPQKLKT